MKDKVLIISYTFPPIPGIGGRRWAKFSKYLHNKGYDVSIITTENTSENVSNWSKDINAFKKKVHTVNPHYPRWLKTAPTTIFEKVMYRLSLAYVKLRTKGNYYDYSAFWGRKLLTKAEQLITEGYTTIIATGAPFGYLSDLARLKSKFPNIKLIADIRDPWMHNTDVYGYSRLPQKRFDIEALKKEKVISSYDFIISVNEVITNDFKSRYREHSFKFKTLVNGYDVDDLKLTEDGNVKNRSKLSFLFAGTFYRETKYLFEEFNEALIDLRKEKKEIYDGLEFTFVGNIPEDIKKMSASHSNIFVEGYLPLKDVYSKINSSDIMMLFLMDEMNYTKSTKFLEYLAHKKPILVLANGGALGEEVERESLGYFANKGKVRSTLIAVYEDFKNNKLPDLKEVDTSRYDIGVLTEDLINLVGL